MSSLNDELLALRKELLELEESIKFYDERMSELVDFNQDLIKENRKLKDELTVLYQSKEVLRNK